MKNKPYAKKGYTRVRVIISLIGFAGTVHFVQAQAVVANGTNDAIEQEAFIKRDPFWPVGYVPKIIANVIPKGTSEQGVAKVDNSWNEAMKKVEINGVSSRANNAYCAVINGQVKSVGDTVTITHGDTIYTWAVDGIEPPSSVKLRRVSAR